MQVIALFIVVVVPCVLHGRFCRCAEMPDTLPCERKMTAADVSEEIRPKLEELLIEGMVVGASVDEMNTLTRLLLAHDQRRLVRTFFCCQLCHYYRE